MNKVVRFLEENGIEYMLTGSLVSSFQGEPRATHDIDIVVRIGRAHVAQVMGAFPAPRYYVSEAAVREAVAARRMFNILDVQEGDKVDFWLLTDEPFDQSRFQRRRREAVFGATIALSSPEDTILAKLRWAALLGGSEKQFTDALRVYELQYALLDRRYLDKWATLLAVEVLWQRLQREAEPLANGPP